MNFVVALEAEAKPLIQALNLKKVSRPSPFTFFQNHKHQLVVSGIGKISAAAATGFMLGKIHENKNPAALINFGVCGHGTLEVGQALVANRIVDGNNLNPLYPTHLINLKLSGSELMTCEQPVNDYQQHLAYDMEAHAFYSTATRGVPRELVQVIKVVSDNPKNPLRNFDQSQVGRLIGSNVEKIITFAEKLDLMADEISTEPHVSKLLNQAQNDNHFTKTQSIQLEKLIQHALVLGLPTKEISDCIITHSSAKEIISVLDQKLTPLRILK